MICVLLVWFFLGAFPAPACSEENGSPESRLAQARSFLDHGDFSRSIETATAAAKEFRKANRPGNEARALYTAASAYQALGRYSESVPLLEETLALAESKEDAKMKCLALISLGKTLFYLGKTGKAMETIEQALDLATRERDPESMARSRNESAEIHEMQKDYVAAIRGYRRALAWAKEAESPGLVAEISANAASAHLLSGDRGKARQLLLQSMAQYRGLPASHDKAYGLTLIGQAYGRLASADSDRSAHLRRAACRAFLCAAAAAREIGDQRALSYALGYMARQYEAEGRNEDALELTRQAVFAAQQVEAEECLYLWEWQTGRLFAGMGGIEDAISAYQAAVESFQSIRHAMTGTCRSWGRTGFRESGGAIFFELADLLLSYSETLTDPKDIKPYLLEARRTIEMLKSAELQDYFADPCVTALQTKRMRLEDIAADAMVVYTITFPDRLDLLLSTRADIRRVAVPVDARTLTAEVRALRLKLAKRTTWDYLPHARKVYDWVIRPLEGELRARRIRTLIFVPDGALRTIPMAALHDGREFIIGKMAVVTTPGLDLTDPRSIHRGEETDVLMAGLSQSAQGYSALENVKDEMDGIESLYEGRRLENEEFVAPKLREALKSKPYPLVHIATHGEFARNASESYLLTWNDRIRMDQLDRLMRLTRFRKDPVELLALSACQTAAGDERAALGLAGIAVKAGARSALATLWSVSDQSAALLIVEFYRRLQDPSVTKAAALQAAQLKLLDSRRYRHPFYWSPFLLIGNWL